MDYAELARQFLETTYRFQKNIRPMKIDESMRGENFVLSLLAQKGECALPGEISSEMNISTARIAATLNSLESKGFITREIDKNDRRRILVELTPEGREQAHRQRHKILEGTTRMMELLGEEDAREFVRILEKLARLGPEIMGNGG